MRPLMDSMILVMALTIFIGTVSYRNAVRQRRENLDTVRRGLVQFDEKLALESALWQSEQQEPGLYPPQVQPEWFKGDLPSNPLLPDGRPWIDIAPANDYSDQPPDPLISQPDQAAFWYNPNLGVVRARIPRQVSNRLTLELYNRVNDLSLGSLPGDDNPDRRPLTFNPNPVTTGRNASPDKRTASEIKTQDPAGDRDGEASAQGENIPWWQRRTYPPDPAEQRETEEAREAVVDRPSLISQ